MSTILVVDDSPMIVDVFVAMLERGGYRPIAAYSGEECLEVLKDVKPDLILLDIMMPGMDGFEALKRLKNDERTYHIPVIMLTAKNEDESKIKASGLYADDYIVKPVEIKTLKAKIHKILSLR